MDERQAKKELVLMELEKIGSSGTFAVGAPTHGTKWSGAGQSPHPLQAKQGQKPQLKGVSGLANRVGGALKRAVGNPAEKSLKHHFPTFNKWMGGRPYGY